MSNTLLVRGRGFDVGLLFALVEMNLPGKAKHTSIKPKWWHRSVHHELRLQNISQEEFIVIKSEFFKISETLSYEVF